MEHSKEYNKELYIIPETKVPRTQVYELVDFFGAAFQQLIRSAWVDTAGSLQTRDFIVLNIQEMGEDEQLVNKSITYELVAHNPDPSCTMCFDLDHAEAVYPEQFSVVMITEDLPALAFTWSVRWDQVGEEDQWSVTAHDLNREDPVQLTGTREQMMVIVCDPNDPAVDETIYRDLRVLFNYGVDPTMGVLHRDALPVGVTLHSIHPQGLPVTKQIDGTWVDDDGGIHEVQDTIPWLQNDRVIVYGLRAIEDLTYDLFDMILLANRRNISCNVDDPKVLVDAAKAIHNELRGRRNEIPTVAFVRLEIWHEINDRSHELRFTVSPTWDLNQSVFIRPGDMVVGPDHVMWYNAVAEAVTMKESNDTCTVHTNHKVILITNPV